jgi:hypothetical protein
MEDKKEEKESVKEIVIPEEFREEVNQITSSRGEMKEWPEFLTEDEVKEISIIMKKREPLQEDGIFVNQYETSMIAAMEGEKVEPIV